jgi:hypothetical protein
MNKSRELNRIDAAASDLAASEGSAASASAVPGNRKDSLFSLVPVGDGIEIMLRLSLSSGAYAGGQSFAARLQVCLSPTCRCGYIGLECRPVTVVGVLSPVASMEAIPLHLEIDVFDRVVKSPPNASPAADALALALAAELQDADWKWLMAYLHGAKRELMKTMDLATLVAKFPREVIEDGSMVGYREVFPWAEIWTFESDAEHWLVVDQYCVQPGCDCADVALVFGQPRDDTAAPVETLPASSLCVYFNYKTGRFRVETEKPGCSAERLISVLRKTYPSLCQDLAQRHRQLQKLARPLIVKSRRNSRWSSLRSWGADPREVRSNPPQAAARPKAPVTGRNDLCPCGSGKKYKKCCMVANEQSNSETGT